MNIKCTKFTEHGTYGVMGEEGPVTSSRFYAFPDDTGTRFKVNVEGDDPDYADVKAKFASLGVEVEESDLRAAYEA